MVSPTILRSNPIHESSLTNDLSRHHYRHRNRERHLESKGTPIGPYDCLIAAQARRRGATLVTANGREFTRVPGLMVTDWVP